MSKQCLTRRGAGVVVVSALTLAGGVGVSVSAQASPVKAQVAAQNPAVSQPVGGVVTKTDRAADARRRAAVTATLKHRRTTQLYIVPHQDDEVLTMGAAIAADVAAKRNVILVLVTQGNNVGGTNRVNRSLEAEDRDRISGKEFVAGRKREFAAAARALGVPAKNVRYLNIPDGGDVEASMRRAVDQLVAQHGNRVAYNSMSWLDQHPTHYHLADRLDALCRVNTLKECHFYQYGAYRVGSPRIGRVNEVVTPIGAWIPDTRGRVVKAAEEYRRWDPDAGRYAIGWRHSVPRSFAALLQKPGSWTHGPSKRDQWSTPADRTAALAWIAKNQKQADPVLAKQR